VDFCPVWFLEFAQYQWKFLLLMLF